MTNVCKLGNLVSCRPGLSRFPPWSGNRCCGGGAIFRRLTDAHGSRRVWVAKTAFRLPVGGGAYAENIGVMAVTSALTQVCRAVETLALIPPLATGGASSILADAVAGAGSGYTGGGRSNLGRFASRQAARQDSASALARSSMRC